MIMHRVKDLRWQQLLGARKLLIPNHRFASVSLNKKHRKDCETALWENDGFIESQPSLHFWLDLVYLVWSWLVLISFGCFGLFWFVLVCFGLFWFVLVCVGLF